MGWEGEYLIEGIKQVFYWILAILLFFFFFGMAIQEGEGMPNNAIVYVNDKTKTYYAPPCLDSFAGLRKTTAGEARRLKYRPDHDCRREGGFTGYRQTLFRVALEKIGLIEEPQSRWNKDGTWNW